MLDLGKDDDRLLSSLSWLFWSGGDDQRHLNKDIIIVLVDAATGTHVVKPMVPVSVMVLSVSISGGKTEEDHLLEELKRNCSS